VGLEGFGRSMRLEEVLATVLDRHQERTERRREHIAG
jgi:hypothetical protein